MDAESKKDFESRYGYPPDALRTVKHVKAKLEEILKIENGVLSCANRRGLELGVAEASGRVSLIIEILGMLR